MAEPESGPTAEDEEWIVSSFLRSIHERDDVEALTGSMALDELVSSSPNDALRVIRRIIREADDRDLAVIAAGPLENLLVENGRLVMREVQALARKDGRFLATLRKAWLSRAPRRVRKDLEEFLATIGKSEPQGHT